MSPRASPPGAPARAVVGGGEGPPWLDVIAEMPGILPEMERLGLATPADVDIDTLPTTREVAARRHRHRPTEIGASRV
jgi:hypothetical protein